MPPRIHHKFSVNDQIDQPRLVITLLLTVTKVIVAPVKPVPEPPLWNEMVWVPSVKTPVPALKTPVPAYAESMATVNVPLVMAAELAAAPEKLMVSDPAPEPK